MQNLINVVSGVNWALVLGVLFGISESLALIPAVNANSVFQLVYGLLKKVLGK